ncbi:MAG: GNAT family N-acetyltransferase [Bacillota bacterium]
MFTGTTVCLRAYRTSDREALERVENDAETLYLAEDDLALPRTERDLDAFLSQASSRGPNYLFVIERLEDGAFLGTVADTTI